MDTTPSQSRAQLLLKAIYDRTRERHEPVSVAELASISGLTEIESQGAWRYLKDRGLIDTFSIPFTARINAAGIDAIESSTSDRIVEDRNAAPSAQARKQDGSSALTPLSFLKEAIRAVPAVKYALGVGGIAAVVAIVAGFNIDYRVAVFGTVIAFSLMFVLVLFARYTEFASDFFYWPSLVATWSFLILIIVTTAFLVSSYFFKWPIVLSGLIEPHVAECFVFDPRSGNQDRSLGSRPCVPGRLAYIKWYDPGPYDPLSGPQDRPNRLVQVASRDPQGFAEWDEYELVKLVDGEERWHTHGQNWVTVMDSYAACGERGALLRRIDLNPIPIADGKTQCDLPGHTRSVKEWLFPADASQRIKRGDHVFICTRDIKFPCDREFGFGLISDGTPFKTSGMEIVNIHSDPYVR